MFNIMLIVGNTGLYSVTCFIMAALIGFLTKVLAGAWPAIEKTYTSFIRGILRQIVSRHHSSSSGPSTANNYGGRNFSSNNSNPQNSNTSNPNSSNHSSVSPVNNNNSNNSNQNNPSSRNSGGDSSSDGREHNGVPDTNGADDNSSTKGRFSQGKQNPDSKEQPGKGTDSKPEQNDTQPEDALDNNPNAANMVKNNNRQGDSKSTNNADGNKSNNTDDGISAKDQAIKDNGNQHQNLGAQAQGRKTDSKPQGFSSILGHKAKNGAKQGLANTGRSIASNAKHPGNMMHGLGRTAKGIGHEAAHPDLAASHMINKGLSGSTPRSMSHGLSHAIHGAKSGIGAVNNARHQAQGQQINGLNGNQSNGQLSTDGNVTAPEAADYGKAADQMLNQSGGLNSKTAANNNSNSNSKNNNPISQSSITSGKGVHSSAKNAMLQHGLNSRNSHLNNHRNGNRMNSNRKGDRNSRMLHNMHNSKQINSMKNNNRRNGSKLSHSSKMRSLSSKAGSMHHIDMPKTMQQAHRNIQSALGQHRAAKSALSNVRSTPNVSPSRQHAAENRFKQSGHHLKATRMAGSMLYESNPTNRNLVRPGLNKMPTNHQTRAALSNVFHAQNDLVHAGHHHAPKATMKSLGTKLNTARGQAKSIGLKPITFSSRPHVAKTMKTLNVGLAHAISGYRPNPAPKLRMGH